MESTRVFGVGLGVFFIAFVWFIALFLSLIIYRVRAMWALILTGAAAAFTAVLPALPRESMSCNDPECTTSLVKAIAALKIIDPLFAPRMVVLSLLGIGVVTGGSLLLYLEVVQPKRQISSGFRILDRSKKIQTNNDRKTE